MRKSKSIRVGIWSYDTAARLCRYASELKKILYNMKKENNDVVLVSSLEGGVGEMVSGLSKLLGMRYDVWLPSRPRDCAKKFNDMEYDIFNRVLFGARGYRIIFSHMESIAIYNHLDILIFLRDGKIYISDISADREKGEKEE